MPIPQMRSDGTLPPGIHPATIDEILLAFPATSARRQLLNLEFIKFTGIIKDMVHEMVVDGSFITNRLEPDDVDIAVWLRVMPHPSIEDLLLQNGVDIQHLIHPWFEISQSEYNKWVQFFSQKLDGTSKGLVQILLT